MPDDPQKPQEVSYDKIHNSDSRDLMQEHNDWEASQWDTKPEVKVEQPPAIPEPPKEKEPEKPVEPQTPEMPEKPPVQESPAPPAPAPEVKTPEQKQLDEDVIVEKLYAKLNPETPEEKKDMRAKVKDLQKKAEAEGRELTYDEALILVKDEAKEELRGELKTELKKEIMDDLNKDADAELKRQQEAKAVQDKQKQDSQQALYKEWDRQWDYLVSVGKVPAIVDPKNPDDEGIKTQRELLEVVQSIANDKTSKGQPVSLSMVEAIMSPQWEQKQGDRTAPVNGARRAVGQVVDDGRPDYMKDIHNMDNRDIVAKLYEQSS